jgi:hypothetical protein
MSQDLQCQEHHHSAKLPLSSEWEDELSLLSENYHSTKKGGSSTMLL